MQIAIRADGGPDIGYGHLTRSSALAREVFERGHTVTVATTTPTVARNVFPPETTTAALSSRGDPQPFVEWLESTNPDLVFTDAYPVDTAYQASVRDRVPLVVLQDDDRHTICADLFVNGNLYAADLDYEFVEQPPKTCLGADYALLRREIHNRAVGDPPWRQQPERAIIMMGGSDTAMLTPRVVRAFDGLNLHVAAIVGPGCSAEQEQVVRRAATQNTADVRVFRDPDDLVDRMTDADLAVSTASSTTYEFLALGTPLVSIPVVDNQQLIAASLRSQDAATVLRRDTGEQTIHSSITELVDSTELRRMRRKKGQILVDGLGTKRVTEAISTITGNIYT
jgi:UDP-2,4-diacetamido-2,4,6-trideoxy-beta-L-altropyranose hydrolase